jgi:hypothetical protein
MLTQQNGKITIHDAVRSVICKIQNTDKRNDNQQETAAGTEVLKSANLKNRVQITNHSYQTVQWTFSPFYHNEIAH